MWLFSPGGGEFTRKGCQEFLRWGNFPDNTLKSYGSYYCVREFFAKTILNLVKNVENTLTQKFSHLR